MSAPTDDISSGSAVDILGQSAVDAILKLHKEALRKAALDPEPPAALAAVVELHIQTLASAIAFAYPAEMRKGCVRATCATLREIVLEEMKDDPSIWVKR